MVDPQAMRDTLRLWASGVSVVTTAHQTAAGLHRSGMTVSAFNSLSLTPPLILVCLHKDANTATLVREAGSFAVSFLAQEQAHLSDRFAGRIPEFIEGDRFAGLNVHQAVTGAPILSDAVAWLDCRISTLHDGGTHWIVIGEVQATGRGAGTAPLLYFDRAYRALGLLEEQA